MSASELSNGSTFGKKICQIFGLEPNIVRRVSLDIPADGFVTINFQVMVTPEQAEAIQKELDVHGVIVNLYNTKKETGL